MDGFVTLNMGIALVECRHHSQFSPGSHERHTMSGSTQPDQLPLPLPVSYIMSSAAIAQQLSNVAQRHASGEILVLVCNWYPYTVTNESLALAASEMTRCICHSTTTAYSLCLGIWQTTHITKVLALHKLKGATEALSHSQGIYGPLSCYKAMFIVLLSNWWRSDQTSASNSIVF